MPTHRTAPSGQPPNVYAALVRRCARVSPGAQPRLHAGPPRVAYYLWRFPSLSETFVQREIVALRDLGLPVEVFADAPQDESLLDERGRGLMAGTRYLPPVTAHEARAAHAHFRRRRPLEYFRLFLFVLGSTYGPGKKLSEDARVFTSAVCLARLLNQHEITRIHSPWANLSAFVALVAARLAAVQYSVQARASADLYRQNSRFALDRKLGHAQFVVTNCHFNRAFIESALGPGFRVPTYVIYEGLDLEQFVPPPRSDGRRAIRILTVARLIEEKGLTHLLRALRLLYDGGRPFQCDIVGGPVEPGGSGHARDLLALRHELGLEGHVNFTGALPFDGVMEHYRRSDVFALPCAPAADGGRDATPNAILEAMAMRLPVVSTAISGIPELIESGVEGILVPPKNAQALAAALARLIDDGDLRCALGERARARAERQFDIGRNARAYARLFTDGVPA